MNQGALPPRGAVREGSPSIFSVFDVFSRIVWRNWTSAVVRRAAEILTSKLGRRAIGCRRSIIHYSRQLADGEENERACTRTVRP